MEDNSVDELRLEMGRSVGRSGKALSPVVSTVIIVAVTIALAIAVTYWLVAIGAGFTRFEQLKLIHVSADAVAGGFNITVIVKSTGSAATTIDAIFFNERSCDVSDLSPANADARNPYATDPTNANITFYGDILSPSKRTLNPGETIRFSMFCASGSPFRTGVNLELSIHSSGGKFYLKTVLLP